MALRISDSSGFVMAHVRPAPIAIDKKAAPRTGRFGSPKEILEAPQIVFTPSSSRILRTSFRKVTIAQTEIWSLMDLQTRVREVRKVQEVRLANC